jgi:hypothetical protein
MTEIFAVEDNDTLPEKANIKHAQRKTGQGCLRKRWS